MVYTPTRNVRITVVTQDVIRLLNFRQTDRGVVVFHSGLNLHDLGYLNAFHLLVPS